MRVCIVEWTPAELHTRSHKHTHKHTHSLAEADLQQMFESDILKTDQRRLRARLYCE